MAGKSDELKVVELTLPVSAQALAQLEIGTVVYLRGNVYTAREGVYRMILDEGGRCRWICARSAW